MYIDKPLSKYLDDLAGKEPTPGGGSSAALTGALGAGLISMVLHFSGGNVPVQVENLRRKLTELIDDDIAGYNKVIKAYKMPREKPEEKSKRSQAIQKALKKALSAPLEVCLLSHQAIKLCKSLVDKANVNLISDVGVSAVLSEAGFSAAYFNVKINLKYLKDEKLVRAIEQILEPLREEMTSYKQDICRRVREKMEGKK